MSFKAAFNGQPTRGDVNQAPPFSFKSSSAVRNDYQSKPGVSALQNPTLHNKVPEAMVNSTARAPLFVRPFQRGFEKSYSEGDILFVKRGDERAAKQHHVVANLPVMNYILRTEKGVGETLKYDSIEKILEDYNYFGILNNDMDTGSKWQRLLNVNVRGRSRVARLWAPERGHLRRGDCLWIGFVKKEGVNRIQTVLDPAGVRNSIPKLVGYYEVLPLMDCCPDFDKAEFKIPIGIVSQVTLKKPHPSALRDGKYVTETCKTLERIEVLMRI